MTIDFEAAREDAEWGSLDISEDRRTRNLARAYLVLLDGTGGENGVR
jgi:hypothetical protein